VKWATGGIASVSKAVPGRLWEGALLVLGLLAVGVFVFDAYPEGEKVLPTLLYLPLPLLLWAALRFGPAGSSTAFMIVALVVIWGASHGRGPFATGAPVENAASVQTFLTFVGAILLVLAAVVRERTNSERKLRSSEERFATAFRASPDAMAIGRKSDGHLIEVNERWLELFDHRREEVVGRTVRELGLFADRNDLERLVTIADEQAHAREVEVSLRTGTGEIIDGLVTTKVAEMEGERRFVTIIRDNTERRRAETALRESEARFRSMADTAPVKIWMSDTERRCTFFNKRWLDFTGRRLEQELGEGWADGVHPDDLERCVSIYTSGFGARRGFEMEFRLRRHDGKYRWVVSIGVPRVGADGTFLGYIGSCLDITDRKEAEETNQRLGHVSRLAVIGELTASIAHEINQPLGAILSNADAAEILLNSKVVPLGELRQIIDDIRKDDLRAGEVIRHIRDLLRRGELALQPFDLNHTIADVVKLMSGELGRQGIAVHTQFAFLPIIDGDHVHLQQVVVNLILNAAEAMAEVPASRRRLTIRTARSDDGAVEVTVADSGPGIAPEAVECLFDSFFTTKSTGMGLGLSIARSIVEAHGGTIWAETRPEGGACFRIVLPVRSTTSGEAPPTNVRESAS
jgi:PAS domain S-box-containing protein